MNTFKLVIWVTSDCTLKCRYCSQKYTMNYFSGYQMEKDEIDYIIDSCKKRNIHFNRIELTGGEPSLWDNLEYGVEMFKKISDDIFLVSNGNNPDRIINLKLDSFIISSSQANNEQLEKYKNINGVSYNSHQHKKLPIEPYMDSLPADCCVKLSHKGLPENNIMYLKGKIYYCCNAFNLTEKTGINENIVCDFEDDFISKFSNKTYNEKICSFCICNQKIWNRI